MRKILTLDDLYAYYAEKESSTTFSADTEDTAIAVSVPGQMTFDDDSQTLGLTPVTLKACHTNTNLNGSRISKETMEAALSSFQNRPILGYIWTDENGDPQFDSHNMHLNEDGTEIVYDETPVGTIPESCNAHLEYDEEADVDRVILNGYLYDDYSKAVDILKREQQCDVSVELSVLDLSYSAEEKVLDINKFVFTGVTILGRDEETGEKVNPGMAGSTITLMSAGTITADQILSGTITANQLTEHEINDVIDQIVDIHKGANANYNEGKEDNTVEDNTLQMENTAEPEATPSNACKYSMSVNGEEHTFELSLGDIQFAIYELVNATYGDDDTWYDVQVYPDSQTVIMYSWWTADEGYRQSYTCDEEGNYSLTGEREAVKKVWLTDAEQQSIDEARSSKSELEAQLEEIQSQLATYQEAEAQAQREALMAHEDYAILADTEEYAELAENIGNYSVDELRTNLDNLLLKYAKKQFAAKKTEVKPVVQFAVNEKPSKKSPYGGLFD